MTTETQTDRTADEQTDDDDQQGNENERLIDLMEEEQRIRQRDVAQTRPNGDERGFRSRRFAQPNDGELEQIDRRSNARTVVEGHQRVNIFAEIRRVEEITGEVNVNHRAVDPVDGEQVGRDVQRRGKRLHDEKTVRRRVPIVSRGKIQPSEKKMIRRRKQRRGWGEFELEFHFDRLLVTEVKVKWTRIIAEQRQGEQRSIRRVKPNFLFRFDADQTRLGQIQRAHRQFVVHDVGDEILWKEKFFLFRTADRRETNLLI